MEKYTRIKKIGEGSFGTAYLVRANDDGNLYVIKEINMCKMTPKEREEARKEVAVLSRMKHPNIVSYRESFEESGQLYIVMDYCDGGDLYSKINLQHGILFTEDQILDWFAQICLAIKHVHDRKILHRDLKSQNIFLNKSVIVQLGDFGIARVLNSTTDFAKTCIGTPYYLSPEICENRPYNHKSDIWSLGCVLYELATLRHAFEAGNMKNLVLKIVRGSYPPVSNRYTYDLRMLIAQLFKRNPRDRPSINAILKKQFVFKRVIKFLSHEQLEAEFSGVTLPASRMDRPLALKPPKAARVSSARSSSSQISDPAMKYGVSIATKKSRNPRGSIGERRKVEEQKMKEMDLVNRRQEMINKEQQRRVKSKMQMAPMQRARDEGWRVILQPTPLQPSPTPSGGNVECDEGAQGNYQQYHSYLSELQANVGRRAQGHAGPARSAAREPQPVIPTMTGGRAAERAQLVEDFLSRKRQAAANKARHALEQGRAPPSGGAAAWPVRDPAAGCVAEVGVGFHQAVRNRQEEVGTESHYVVPADRL
ncbi:PREDICTED: serine/threonine-protein kinase Nek1-like [Priapulus caudatus]|uniref:non-specific serine/threonine protein kinase n=1 Tax=Priapulus caudatus TaxID=37621 RepID=A0ABM1DYS0_PRICU|nr:PREDICTED: serine/threonine-protein kinase Nek1-like [Priapulus caudatus]